MRLLAESGGVRARFVEHKYLAILSSPVENEGFLYFDPPDRMAREVRRPAPSSMVVRGDLVVMRDATGEQRVRLDESEVARGLVESFLVVLRGEVETLRSRYEISFRSSGETWQLELTPRSRAMRQLVDAITIEGRRAEMLRTETREAGGDRTVTEFRDVQTGQHFSRAELEKIFLVPRGSSGP